MTAFNIVRIRVRPEHLDDVLRYYGERDLALPGLKAMTLVQTGERDFCLIGEWSDMEAIAAARPAMIASLDEHRAKLEDLGGGLGVTDPISGEAVVERRL
ncbi:MAG: antibiotic biosynthesis monooxygenase [Amaricoccus sp.]